MFFREKYQSYKKALNKFQDGLAVIAIYLKVSNLINKYTMLRMTSALSIARSYDTRLIIRVANYRKLWRYLI